MDGIGGTSMMGNDSKSARAVCTDFLVGVNGPERRATRGHSRTEATRRGQR